MVTVSHENEEKMALEEEEAIELVDLKERVSFCPNCKSLQTLLFSRGELVGQRRYSQHDGYVYHDCGSDKPCRFL